MIADLKLSPANILKWSHMEDWVSGASSAPTEHTLSGAGASIARESTTVKSGTYSAAVNVLELMRLSITTLQSMRII